MKIEDLVRSYQQQLRADGRSECTVGQCVRHGMLMGRFFGEREVEAIDHTDVARFLTSAMAMRTRDGRPKKATSVNALRSSVRTIFAFAHAAGYVTANPARLVRRARCSPPPPRALSDVDRERLVAELAKATTWTERRDRALFMTLLLGGLRIGSAIGAHVEDIDLNAGELRLRRLKGGAEDVVLLAPALVEHLRAWVGERHEGPLFPTQDGRALGCRQAHRRLQIVARQAGITRTVSPHVLRHSFAMAVYHRSGDILVTSRALCHHSTASTAVYARASVERVRAAIAG